MQAVGILASHPSGVKHFNTDCSPLDDVFVPSTQRLVSSSRFSAYDVILNCAGEEAAANFIRSHHASWISNDPIAS